VKRFFGQIFLISSVVLFLFGGYLMWERTNPYHASLLSYPAPLRIHGQPDYIEIPNVHISLPIYPGNITAMRWSQTTRGVSYLSSTPLPGYTGNSVLYGHNWPNLLGPLHRVRIGDTIYITYGSKRVSFTVRYITVVKSSDVSILTQTSDKRVTIYTCTGFLDNDRLVITALSDDTSGIEKHI
jgi:LPXTG-site transpeptidase (sortase) family protein